MRTPDFDHNAQATRGSPVAGSTNVATQADSDLDPTPLRPTRRRQAHRSHGRERQRARDASQILGQTARGRTQHRRAASTAATLARPMVHQAPSRSATTPRSRTAAVCPGPEGVQVRHEGNNVAGAPLPHVRQAAGDRDGLIFSNKTASCETSTSATQSIRRHATLALHE